MVFAMDVDDVYQKSRGQSFWNFENLQRLRWGDGLRFGLWSWTCEFCEFVRYTHSSSLKNDGWKITFLLGWLLFRGYVKLPRSTHIFPSIIDDWMVTGVFLGNEMLIFWQG